MESKTKFLNAQSSFNNLGLCDTQLLCVWANDRLIQKKRKKKVIQKVSSLQFSIQLKKSI